MTYYAAAFLPFSLSQMHKVCVQTSMTAYDSYTYYSKTGTAEEQPLTFPAHREQLLPLLHHSGCNCTCSRIISNFKIKTHLLTYLDYTYVEPPSEVITIKKKICNACSLANKKMKILR